MDEQIEMIEEVQEETNEEVVPEINEEKKPKIDWIAEIKDLLITFVVCFIAVWTITNFVVKPVQVDGDSMYPTLEDQERGFSSVISKHFDIERFDIVVVESQSDSNVYWVKRVIGLPNETISCVNDVIYIDGKAIEQDFLDENYVASEKQIFGSFTRDFGPIVLGENEYFLMGDNRNHSTDSRSVGAFSKEDITSVGIFVYFPFSEFGGK